MASIYKDGGKWYINFKDGSSWVRKSLKTSNKQIAIEKLHVVQEQEDRGLLNIPIRAEDISVQQFVDEYLVSCQTNHSKRTYGLEKSVLNNFIKYCISKNITQLNQISLSLLENYKSMRIKKVSPSCLNRELTIFCALLSRAVQLRKLPANPLRDPAGKNMLKRLREPEKKVQSLSRDEIKALMKAANNQWKAIIAVTISTGLRRAELQHLRWKDIDFNRNQIDVVNHTEFHTKSRKNRFIPMNKICRETLRKLKQTGTYVFGLSNGKAFVNNFNREFNKLRQSAGLKHITFHMLRHTFASELVGEGVPLKVVQEFLGHASIRTTEIYTHLLPSRNQAEIQKLKYKFPKK